MRVASGAALSALSSSAYSCCSKRSCTTQKYGALALSASPFRFVYEGISLAVPRGSRIRLSQNMKRILVPIDFSDATPPVIDLARQLAKGLDAEIHLVHVRELSVVAAPGALGYGLAGMPELAPVSGVPVPVFDAMAEPVP